MKTRFLTLLAFLGIAGLAVTSLPAATTPKAGDPAPGFELKTLDDQSVSLKKLTSQGPVVLVVLRGWPGYQCPACDRQVQDFIKSSDAFQKAGATVAFVYPGPAADLKKHAKEFAGMKGKVWPKEFVYLLDPDYTMVNAYALRWDAPNETAYPATFVIDGRGTVRHANVSRSHGGRTKAPAILAEVEKLK